MNCSCSAKRSKFWLMTGHGGCIALLLSTLCCDGNCSEGSTGLDLVVRCGFRRRAELIAGGWIPLDSLHGKRSHRVSQLL